MRRRGSRMDGKKLPLRSLGMASSTSPALVVSTRGRCPLRSLERSGPLIALGPDDGGQLDLDQLLADQGGGFFDEVETLTRLECIEQFGQDRLIQGHRCVLLLVGSARNTPRITPLAPPIGGPRLTSKPTTPRDTARWLGAPCFENSDTALPWGFDTSAFRSGAVVQREHAGPSPRRMSDRNRPASPRRHRIKAVRRALSPEAGGRYPVGYEGRPIGLPHAVRSSSEVERVAVNHHPRGFDALLRSPGTVTEDLGTRLQPGPRR